MKTFLHFQTIRKNAKRPDDTTLSLAVTEIDNAAMVPNIGDVITDVICVPLEDRGKYRSFRVVGKNYVYDRDVIKHDLAEKYPNSQVAKEITEGYGAILKCDIYVTVTPADDDYPGVDIKQ